MTNSVSRMPGKGIRAWSTRVLGLASMVSMLACGNQESGPTQSSSDDAKSKLATHKVQLSTKQVQELEERGAKLHVVGDYGAFKLVQVDDKALASLPEGAEVRDDFNEILLNAGKINTASTHGQSLRGMRMQAGAGRRLHMVQFKGPVKPEWYRELEATGVRVVTYIPNNAYIVYGDATSLGNLQQHINTTGADGIQWDGEYLTDFKLNPTIHTLNTEAYEIQLVKDDEANRPTLDLINRLQTRDGKITEALGYVTVTAYMTLQDVQTIAAQPDVFSVIPHVPMRKMDERQNMIVSGNLSSNGTVPNGPGWLEWLASKGFTQEQFTASGFGVDVTDSGVDNAVPATPNHFGLYTGGSLTSSSRLAYARLEGTPNSGSTIQGCDGHGTLNAHIIGGYSAQTGAPYEDAQGFNYGMGVAPFVKVGSSVIFDPGFFTTPDYEDLQSRAYRDSMRISSNSWGAASNVYNVDSQRYDALVRDAQPSSAAVPNPGNQEMVIVFAAGNNGPTAGSIIRPGNAKNLIAAGANENVQAFGQPDQCLIADADADNAMDIVFFSSRGPTGDGRKKPDLMAPGSHVSGGVAQADGQRTPPGNPNGQALSCFDATGVCAGPGSNNFFPVGQQWFTASSGTSHSTPAIAGGAALLRQYFINQGMAPPSPAMTKGYLMNSARYMTGSGANDTLWSNNQGMGLMDLGMALDGTPRMLDDQNPENLFTASGQSRTFSGTVGDATKPFRVTLAWTDAPGSTTGSAWNNNLDLTVTVGGTTYKGNVFNGANSATGGNADNANNVESVFLPAGASGPFSITVTATNITSDGVPGNASALDQDFALLAYNTCGTAPSQLTDVTATITGENQIEIAWTNNDAEQYNVYRATTAGGPYTLVHTAASSPWVDDTVSGGTTYYYVVKGAICVESPASNEASATATGPCTLRPDFAGVASVSNSGADTCGTAVTWAEATAHCGGTLSYSVYRSTVAGFTPSIANKIATDLTGTSFTDDLNLTSGITYYYVVRATETAEAIVEEQNTVEKSARPTGPIAPGTFFDDLDDARPPNANAYWIATTQTGAAGTIQLTSGCHYQSPTSSWRFGAANSTACGGTYPNSLDATLVLGGNGAGGINGMQVPNITEPAMSFALWYSFETSWDGAWLVYSTTGPTGPWTVIGDAVSTTQPYILSGGYDGTINGIGNRVWTSTSQNPNGSLKHVAVNLNTLAGQTVWFGFKFHTDSSVVREGIYIDEIRLDAAVPGECTTNVPPPGPAVSYKVDRLPDTAGAGDAVTFNVIALDAVGQTATGYAGSASFTSSDPRAQLPPSATFTDGVASDVPAEFRTTGEQSITASDTANPAITGSASIDITPATPDGLSFTAQPGTTVAGENITPAVKVSVVDRFGNPVGAGTNSITVAIGNNAGNGTLSGTTTAAAAAGVATFANLSINKIGAGYTLVASTGGLNSGTSAGFEITPAAPVSLQITTQPSNIVAGEHFNPAVAVLIKDRFNNPSYGSISVALRNNPGNGNLLGNDVVEAVNGTATFSDLSVDKVGSGYTLIFGSGTLPTVISSAFDVSPAAPYRAVITREPVDTVVGRPITPAVLVEIRDRFDNLATQATTPVSAALGSNPRSATLRGTTSVNPAGGVATFSDLSVSRAGLNYTLIFGSSGLHSDTSVGFDITARTGSSSEKLAFRPVAASATAGASLGTIEVELQDLDGNLLTGETQLVTLSLGESTEGAQLLGTTTVAAVDGVAKFEGLSLRKAGGGYSLVARADGFDSATSSAFAVVPAAAASFVVTLPSSITAGEETSISATAYDAYGNMAANYGGTVQVTSSDSSATFASSATFVEGKLTNFKVTFKSKGLKTITLTDGSLTSTSQVNVTPFGQPVATVTSPEGGRMVEGKVTITATGAVAAGNTLTKLQILVDGVEIANGTNAELSGTWDSENAEPGSHVITAAVTDGAGNVVTSAPVIVFKDGGCGCGATSGTDAGIYLALLVLARYLLRRRDEKTAA
jgi:hypothetical protein